MINRRSLIVCPAFPGRTHPRHDARENQAKEFLFLLIEKANMREVTPPSRPRDQATC